MPYELHFVSCVASLDAVHTNSIAVSRVTGPTTGNITSKSHAKSHSKNIIRIHCHRSSRWLSAMQDCGNCSVLRMELRQFSAKLLTYVGVVKYECDLMDLVGTFTMWKISPIQKLTNRIDFIAPSPVHTVSHQVANIDCFLPIEVMCRKTTKFQCPQPRLYSSILYTNIDSLLWTEVAHRKTTQLPGNSLGIHPANERRYNVTFLIGWAHT